MNKGNTTSIINQWAKKDVVLQSLISEFYKANFWDVNKLDQVDDQQIANTIYDMSVNAGVGIGAKMLQRAASVTADGIIGSETLVAVNSGNAKVIYDNINEQRKAYYNNIIVKNPSQEVFRHSWLSRLVPYK